MTGKPTTMQIDGKLAKWNGDRGFGFIEPTHGGQEIFVHVSAFPRDGRRPQIGEALSFEIETTADGKKRAKSVQRPLRIRARNEKTGSESRTGRRTGFIRRVLPLLILAAIGAYAYGEYSKRGTRSVASTQIEAQGMTERSASPNATTHFRCDGRTHCSQMTSCAEATYFLQNCPGVKMDGNNDGIPCEQQWCIGSFGR